VNQAGFNIFQAVGFFADVFDLLDSNMSSLQQADRLLTARDSVRIGALDSG
jgi:hypothetical protein